MNKAVAEHKNRVFTLGFAIFTPLFFFRASIAAKRGIADLRLRPSTQ
jgi:hypothetical protein